MYEKPYQIIYLIRIKHWVKNIVILFPIFFAGDINKIFSTEMLILLILFCTVSSSIYIINDIVDVKSDKNHPFKKYRPYAAGLITTNQCNVLILILLIFCTLLLISTNKEFFF